MSAQSLHVHHLLMVFTSCALVHTQSITQALLLMHKQTVYLDSRYNNIFLLEDSLVYLHSYPN